ncbi:Rieske (2Fe-2S) protein [Amycolatopsis sp. K13G38]|uniref:Rieske (2Fe-2S) protein n=1 Tax=Amycolatopsis acididurans TaxID=2724524 RepID=A0ABX1IZK0_9PSEU|nr:Rieske (2Fe-2S) protein [Amycolatopsis acididurans]NKQ51545.1 Rieske (2Fe-2S) protein [Amycolatopsis acididurans]
MTVFDLGRADEVLAGGRARVTLGPDETPVLIVRTWRGVFAMRNSCPHRARPLDEATVRGRLVRCPFHGREYDLRGGRCRSAPREPGLRVYRAWIRGGRLFVAL